jgi:predicted ATP-dependent serine protease
MQGDASTGIAKAVAIGVQALVGYQRVSPERRAVRLVDSEDAAQLMAVLAESA